MLGGVLEADTKAAYATALLRGGKKENCRFNADWSFYNNDFKLMYNVTDHGHSNRHCYQMKPENVERPSCITTL